MFDGKIGTVDYSKAVEFIHKYGTGKTMSDEYFDVISDLMEQVMKACHKKTLKTLEALKPKH